MMSDVHSPIYVDMMPPLMSYTSDAAFTWPLSISIRYYDVMLRRCAITFGGASSVEPQSARGVDAVREGGGGGR